MFNNIIGNKEIKENLIKSLENNKTSHSYLFIGIEGIGKKLIAKEFAKSILCINNKKSQSELNNEKNKLELNTEENKAEINKEENLICNNCKSCIEFDTNNNPDFYLITPDGNSIKIEQIREMQKKVAEKPIISKNKVYIIDESDKMTKEAQNSLLKTLEEPPEYVTIILIAENENMILSTIKSRCTILHFKQIPNNELRNFLKTNYNIEEIEENILNSFQGSIGKAIKLKDKKESLEKIYKLIKNIKTNDIIDLSKMAEILYKEKDDIQDLLEYINTILINQKENTYQYAQCIEIIENTKKRLKSNANYDMTIDNLIFRMKEILN